MSKQLTRVKLAEEHAASTVETRNLVYEWIKEAYLAGWAARGKEDKEVVLAYDIAGNLTEVFNGIGTLDEE